MFTNVPVLALMGLGVVFCLRSSVCALVRADVEPFSLRQSV